MPAKSLHSSHGRPTTVLPHCGKESKHHCRGHDRHAAHCGCSHRLVVSAVALHTLCTSWAKACPVMAACSEGLYTTAHPMSKAGTPMLVARMTG